MDNTTAPYSEMFAGKRLLVVGGGYFLTDEVRQKLHELGAIIVGPVADLEYVADLIDRKGADAAILDLDLAADRVFPLVEGLEVKNIPYIFALGQEPIVPSRRFTGFVLCKKAVAIEHIAKGLFKMWKKDV